ncbi:DMT family transporter [Chitinimonas lacunae]|uniref:DMT family transporter n=1 Tax=Chitinimonas lacunae TaxID=1963018 RepID=A0ABV8MS67_9NEIS
MSISAASRSPALAYVLLTLTSLFWSGNFVLARAMHASIPPMTLSLGRWLVALACLAPFAWPRAWANRAALKASWRRVVALGLIGIAGFNTLVYAALQETSATNGVLMNSFIPILILLLGAVFWGERLVLRQISGVALSFIGVVVILCQGDPVLLARLEFNRGDLLMFLAALDWALYTLVVRGLDPEVDRLGLLGVIIPIGLLAILPCYGWEVSQGHWVAMTPGNIVTFLYVGLFPSVLAYLFYNRGVAEVGAARAGAFIHLMPVFGTVLSIVFLDERFRWFHALGVAAIFGGLLISERRRPAAVVSTPQSERP